MKRNETYETKPKSTNYNIVAYCSSDHQGPTLQKIKSVFKMIIAELTLEWDDV